MANNTSEKSKALFLMFKKVVEAERGAQAMYEEIISVCEDATLKDIFKGFHNPDFTLLLLHIFIKVFYPFLTLKYNSGSLKILN